MLGFVLDSSFRGRARRCRRREKSRTFPVAHHWVHSCQEIMAASTLSGCRSGRTGSCEKKKWTGPARKAGWASIQLVQAKTGLLVWSRMDACHQFHDPGVNIRQHLCRDFVTTWILPNRYFHASGMKESQVGTDSIDRVTFTFTSMRNQ